MKNKKKMGFIKTWKRWKLNKKKTDFIKTALKKSYFVIKKKKIYKKQHEKVVFCNKKRWVL